MPFEAASSTLRPDGCRFDRKDRAAETLERGGLRDRAAACREYFFLKTFRRQRLWQSYAVRECVESSTNR
jgi:hypothetical protein